MADDDQKMHFSTDQSEGACKNLMNHNYECKLNNQNQITVNSKEYALCIHEYVTESYNMRAILVALR